MEVTREASRATLQSTGLWTDVQRPAGIIRSVLSAHYVPCGNAAPSGVGQHSNLRGNWLRHLLSHHIIHLQRRPERLLPTIHSLWTTGRIVLGSDGRLVPCHFFCSGLRSRHCCRRYGQYQPSRRRSLLLDSDSQRMSQERPSKRSTYIKFASLAYSLLMALVGIVSTWLVYWTVRERMKITRRFSFQMELNDPMQKRQLAVRVQAIFYTLSFLNTVVGMIFASPWSREATWRSCCSYSRFSFHCRASSPFSSTSDRGCCDGRRTTPSARCFGPIFKSTRRKKATRRVVVIE